MRTFVPKPREKTPEDLEFDRERKLLRENVPRSVIQKRKTLLSLLNSGTHPHVFGGYPQPWDETIFKIRVGYDYRMFVQKNDAGVWVELWIGTKSDSAKYCRSNGDIARGVAWT